MRVRVEAPCEFSAGLRAGPGTDSGSRRARGGTAGPPRTPVDVWVVDSRACGGGSSSSSDGGGYAGGVAGSRGRAGRRGNGAAGRLREGEIVWGDGYEDGRLGYGAGRWGEYEDGRLGRVQGRWGDGYEGWRLGNVPRWRGDWYG